MWFHRRCQNRQNNLFLRSFVVENRLNDRDHSLVDREHRAVFGYGAGR